MGWMDALVGFDTETTGIDTGTDRIVTAAVVRRVGGTTTVRTWLLDPGVEIPEAASAVHGISTEHARTHGRAPAEALEEIAAALAESVSRGEALVIYNASYDLSILDAELRRHGLTTLTQRLGREVQPVLDPLVLDRHYDRYRRGKRTLGHLCTHYAVVTGPDLHSAEVDVAATLDVLAALVARFPELAELPPHELHTLQGHAHRGWAERFNQWRREQGLTGPGADLNWPTRQQEQTAELIA